ncbi:tigger transposable element-derived 6-like [Paramuricea clavata]|uniref:Tigger transposable element-derived 6-like n=1 Tax=Paramuricea clavata TaxID=317549 RepID=A0A7D9I1I3_PARCT|nr:tigger transposable element-derived 6-like [Paramuricea clavata]
MKRNPQVKVRKVRPLEKKRARITQEDVDKWFSEYQEFLLKKNLIHQPGQIWNCDETGFDLNGRVGKVIGPSKQKEAPYQVMSGNMKRITMLPCFNASGQWMPPYFIFPGKRIPATYNPLEGGVDGSVFSMTESGYMNTETFYMWLANHFIPNLPPKRPVLLLVDSHDSHLHLATFELAEKKSMWEDVMCPSILTAAFRKSGIYPLDKSEVSKGLLGPSNQSFDANQRVDKDSTSPSLQAFEALDAALSTPSRAKYRRRIEEGYDLNGSPTFSAWNKLYKSANPSHAHHDGKGETSQTSQRSHHAEKPIEPHQPSSSTESNVLKEILTSFFIYTIQPKGPPKRVNAKRTIPNFISGPTSKQILLDEKLKKARQLADKQKRLYETQQRKEEKRKKVEDEKIRKEKKKQEKERMKEQKQKTRNIKGAKKTSSCGRSDGRMHRNLKRTCLTFSNDTESIDENICSMCSEEYLPIDDENNPWVMCDSCNLWMHIECIPMEFDVDVLHSEEPFYCHQCNF